METAHQLSESAPRLLATDPQTLALAFASRRLRLFNERARFGALFSFAGIGLLGWVISEPAGMTNAATWCALVGLTELAIVLVAIRCESALNQQQDATLWWRAHVVLAAMAGAGWGSAVWFIWTGHDPEWYMAAISVIIGVGGVAMVPMSSYKSTALLFYGGLYALPMVHVMLCEGPSARFLEFGLLVALMVQLGFTRELGRITTRDVQYTAHNAALIDELNALLIRDQLTGTHSRRYTLERLEQLIAMRERHATPASVIMLDLDHFKRINDTYGHATGDRALCAAVRVVEQALRTGDILGRIGGEEFLVILPETDTDAAQVLAERLRQTLEQTEVSHGDSSVAIPASFGIAEVVPKESLAQLLARVDAALYASKENGRNRVTVAQRTV